MADSIIEQVRSQYGAAAVGDLSSDHAGVRAVAEAFGYTPEELASIPAEANMGLSCGNPTAFANLRPGETVVDLGCGGGLDVLLAAPKVGPTGKAIGIDMTPEMIDRARRNAAGVGNVEFHLATIDRLPLADASVDCLISNCVINLAAGQGRRLPRDVPRAKVGRSSRRERHRLEAAAAAGFDRQHRGLHRLYRGGCPDRRLPASACGGGFRRRCKSWIRAKT